MSSIGIRSLTARLKKISSKITTTHLDAFEKSLRPEQREALFQASLQSVIAEDDEDREAIAIETLMKELGLDEDEAVDLWTRYQTAQQSEPTDPELQRLTDEELIEHIERTRQEIRELVVETQEA